MSNIIDKIRLSGTDYTLSATSSGGNPTVELTQAEYDALVSAGTVSADTYYIITDAQAGDLTQYWTSAQTNSAITQAVSGKQDTLVSGTNIKTINNISILGSGNIDIQGGGGGGKAVTGGTNISVTTGETADTINCTLPIIVSTNSANSLKLSGNDTYINFANYSVTEGYKGGIDDSSHYSHKEGYYSKIENYCQGSHVEGWYCEIIYNSKYSHAEGYYTRTTNESEHSSGRYNVSNKANSTFGDSGNTLFSVGNGTSTSARHNAFEVRQNGDIYITSGGTTSSPMIKLQDQLGGGGGITSGEVQSMIDESISGKTDESAFTAHTANTNVHVTAQDKTNWNNKSNFSGDYNDLTNKPTIPTVPTNVSDFTNDAGYITSNDISGKTNQSDFTAHTADTTIHVTSTEKAAWNAKSDFSGSYNDLTNKLSAGTNITIVDNVISAEGGGKAIEAGRGISVTTGETADTVSFNLPISGGSGEGSIIGGFSGNTASGKYSFALGGRYEGQFNYQYCRATGKGAISFGGTASGQGAFSCGENPQALGSCSVAFGDATKAIGIESFVIGRNTTANTFVSFAQGRYTKTTNEAEVALGEYNNSVSGSSTFGDSGNTLFSVGNGISNSARHNAFEIRQNGDIYITSGGTTSSPMIKLQDQLGSGGASYSAGTGIDITNNVISVTGMVATSSIVTAVTSSSTDSEVPSAKCLYDTIGNIETLLSQI